MRVTACLLVAGLLFSLVACGGDDEAVSSTQTPSSSPSTTGPPPLADGVQPGPGVTETEIRLGMTSDLTAAGNTPYGAVSTATHAYFAKVNAEDGGVCGRNLVLIQRDDKYNAQEALAQTQSLVDLDQVLGVIGGLGTRAHVGVADYLNDPNSDGDKNDGVPDMFVSTGYSGWGDTTRWPWTFGFIPDYQADGRILAKYINDVYADKNVGILYQDDEFGNDYLFAMRASLPDPSLVVSEQPIDPAAPAIEPFVTNLIEAEAAIVVLATPPEVSAAAINAAHAQNYKPLFMLSYVNSYTHLAMLVGGGSAPDQLAKGISDLAGSISTAYLLSAVEDETDPALIEHERIMQTYDGPPVSTLSIYSQALAETVVETLSRTCHNPTRRGFLDAAQTMQSFHPTVLLPGIYVNLSPDDHRSLQTLQTVEFRPDGTLAEIGEPVPAE